jgi:hypothetical protein
MNKNQVWQLVFLGLALIIAVSALIQVLHEVAYAGPECSSWCVCDPAPCGLAVIQSQTCWDTRNCYGTPANPANCGEYCVNTR